MCQPNTSNWIFFRSFVRRYVSAASAIADTVTVVSVVVFYLSFDCYRKRHSFDRFVYVSVCVCVRVWVCANVFSIYFINYIIDYILRVICVNENFVLQLIHCCWCRVYPIFYLTLVCELIQAQVGLLNLPNTTTAGIGNTH